MNSIVEIGELGRRIRKLRLDRRMTLKQVEIASGLSATHLSEIERGRTSPTIGALVRIARALDKDASYFIEHEERTEVAHQTYGEGRVLELARGVSAETLTAGIPGSRIFAYRLKLDGSKNAEIAIDAQEIPGEAIYMVHKGALATKVGDAELTLKNGDALQATLNLPHRICGAAGETTEVIALFTRPISDYVATRAHN